MTHDQIRDARQAAGLSVWSMARALRFHRVACSTGKLERIERGEIPVPPEITADVLRRAINYWWNP